jgi:PleD family two-component response regulator
MTLRILLAESETEDVLFLRDVLEEMEGGIYWSSWVHIEVFDAPTWKFAEAILSTEPIDIALLDLNLPDSRGAETFRRSQSAAPHVPVVLLVEEADVELAERLVRDGAQDFLVKKQVDCAPLAHAVRSALDRNRLLAAARAATMTDPLTGLLNLAAFQALADRDRRLAERLGKRMAVIVAEPRNLAGISRTYGEQRRDLTLVETADQLRVLAGPIDLVARISEGRFGISVFETDAEPIEAACARFEEGCARQTLAAGSAIFDPHRPLTLDRLLEAASLGLGPLEAGMPGMAAQSVRAS